MMSLLWLLLRLTTLLLVEAVPLAQLAMLLVLQLLPHACLAETWATDPAAAAPCVLGRRLGI